MNDINVEDIRSASKAQFSQEYIDQLIKETEYRKHFPIRSGYGYMPMNSFSYVIALARINKFLLPIKSKCNLEIDAVLAATKRAGLTVK